VLWAVDGGHQRSVALARRGYDGRKPCLEPSAACNPSLNVAAGTQSATATDRGRPGAERERPEPSRRPVAIRRAGHHAVSVTHPATIRVPGQGWRAGGRAREASVRAGRCLARRLTGRTDGRGARSNHSVPAPPQHAPSPRRSSTFPGSVDRNQGINPPRRAARLRGDQAIQDEPAGRGKGHHRCWSSRVRRKRAVGFTGPDVPVGDDHPATAPTPATWRRKATWPRALPARDGQARLPFGLLRAASSSRDPARGARVSNAATRVEERVLYVGRVCFRLRCQVFERATTEIAATPHHRSFV
jgi:hypothetical protein